MGTRRLLVVAAAFAVLSSACGGAQPAASSPTTAASSAAAATATATADAKAAVEAFYRGKTVRIVVGYQPGGGFDTTSRILAQHIGNFIPGNPTVVVENMEGAGSRVAANWLYEVAPKDGTVIGLFNEQQILQQVLGDEGIKFDAAKFTWLGSVFDATVTCIARADSGLTSIKDVMGSGGKKLIVGGTAPGANTDDFPTILKAALGANIQIVSGYDGSKGIETAMNSGEVQGGCWTWDSMRRSELDPVKSGSRVLLVQQGDEPIGDFTGIPMAADLATDAKNKSIIEAIATPNLISKPFSLPPGVPADRAAAIKDAFAKTMQDDAFKADCTKAKLEIAPKTAAQLQKVIDQLFGMDKATTDALKAALAAGR